MRSLCYLGTAAILGFAAHAFGADELMTSAQALFKPIPASPPALPGNPGTPAKVELGKMLYFDPRLSASHAISCNSCHNVGLAGADAEQTSIGHKWQRGDRNAPTVLTRPCSRTHRRRSRYSTTLRNIALTAPYFHTGRSWDLRQAVAVMGTSQLGAQLSAEETDNIVAFLGALAGEQPEISYPILPPSVAATPRPQP